MILRVLALAALSISAPALADPPRAMTPTDMIDLPSIGAFDLSPDGERLAYVRETSDWERNRRTSAVWVVDLESGEKRQWLHGRDRVGSPRWSPDGAWLAFLAEDPETDEKQLYVSPTAGGDAFPVTASETSVSDIQWSPDGEPWVYYRATDKPKEHEAENRNLIRPFDSRNPSQLYRVRVPDGETEQLTRGPLHVRSYHASPAGVVVHRSRGALIDDRHTSSTLWRMDLEGSGAERFAGPSHTQEDPRLSPEGDRVLYLADMNDEGEPYYQTNLFVFDVDEPETRWELVPDESFQVLSAQWGATHDVIHLVANVGVSAQLFELSIDTGELSQLTTGEHNLLGWRRTDPGSDFVLHLRTASSPGELWTLKSEPGAEPKQATTEHSELADEFVVPPQQLVSWQSDDGVEIEALLTTPTDGSAAPYPLVVQSHGGPRSSDRWGVWKWGNYQPVLASMGYATLRVNYRGSTGYGEAFHRSMVGDYWRHAHTDVLAGVDHLVAQGIADPDRLAAMGWSAGGHMTNKLITVTDRFRAASSGAGAVDWVSMYGESDTRARRTPWFGAPPWSEDASLDAYRRQSPLFDAWRVTTPTLLFVGEEDRRVPRTQSILYARALTAAGVPNHLYVAPGQGHGWARLNQRLFKINAELEWFERHVRGRDYEWHDAE